MALIVFALAGMLYLHHDATDFPTEDPIHVVDAALIERLRQSPGLHLALAEDYELRMELDLADDPLNRKVYGTRIDLREQVPERSIHIQFKGERGAIHADGTSPKNGLWGWLVHATVDVPFLPLPILLCVGVVLVAKRSKKKEEEWPPKNTEKH